MKFFFLTTAMVAVVMGICGKAQAGQKLTFLDLAKDAHGNVALMYQFEAIKYCEDRGARLPSARELAHLASKHGAKGIVRTWDKCRLDKECNEMNTISADGNPDIFYFSYSGYKRPTDNQIRLWSSSTLAIDSGYAFYLDDYFGAFDFKNFSVKLAVRCVTEK